MNDDTCMFAIFHPSEPQTPGLPWFLFPAHRLVIQISGVGVVSWEGNSLEHCCICSVVKGFFGECLKSGSIAPGMWHSKQNTTDDITTTNC